MFVYTAKALLFIMLNLMLVQTSFAEDISRNHTELKELADRLDSFGYQRSALHYYELLERDPKVEGTMRKEVEEKVTTIRKKLKGKSLAVKALPQLDAFPNFTVSKPKAVEAEGGKLLATEFPRTRISKKKWIITGLVIVSVGVIAYKVNRNLRKKKQHQLEITF